MNSSFLSEEDNQEKFSSKINQENINNTDRKVLNKIEDEPHDQIMMKLISQLEIKEKNSMSSKFMQNCQQSNDNLSSNIGSENYIENEAFYHEEQKKLFSRQFQFGKHFTDQRLVEEKVLPPDINQNLLQSANEYY